MVLLASFVNSFDHPSRQKVLKKSRPRDVTFKTVEGRGLIQMGLSDAKCASMRAILTKFWQLGVWDMNWHKPLKQSTRYVWYIKVGIWHPIISPTYVGDEKFNLLFCLCKGVQSNIMLCKKKTFSKLKLFV